MRDIIKYLEKYDSNLTVLEVIETIKNKEAVKIRESKDLEDDVISRFEGKYFKLVGVEGMWSNVETTVFSLTKFLNKERTVDWDYLFNFNLDRIVFSERETYKICNVIKGLSLEELEDMTLISEVEYLQYNWKHENIKKQLEELL